MREQLNRGHASGHLINIAFNLALAVVASAGTILSLANRIVGPVPLWTL